MPSVRQYTTAPRTPRRLPRSTPYPPSAPNSGKRFLTNRTIDPQTAGRPPSRRGFLGLDLSDQEEEQEELEVVEEGEGDQDEEAGAEEEDQEEEEEEKVEELDHWTADQVQVKGDLVVKIDEGGEGPSNTRVEGGQGQGRDAGQVSSFAMIELNMEPTTAPASHRPRVLSQQSPAPTQAQTPSPTPSPPLTHQTSRPEESLPKTVVSPVPISPGTFLKQITSTELPLSRISFAKKRPKPRKKRLLIPAPTIPAPPPNTDPIESRPHTFGEGSGPECGGLTFKPDGEVRDVYVLGSEMVVKVRVNRLEYTDGSHAISQPISEHVNLSLQYLLNPFLHYLTFRHTDVSSLPDDFYLLDDPVIFRFQRIPHGEGHEYKRDKKTIVNMWEELVIITPTIVQ